MKFKFSIVFGFLKISYVLCSCSSLDRFDFDSPLVVILKKECHNMTLEIRAAFKVSLNTSLYNRTRLSLILMDFSFFALDIKMITHTSVIEVFNSSRESIKEKLNC